MTRTIVELARELQQHLAPNSTEPTAEEARLQEIGRLQATQIIDAIRMGDKTPGLLMCALWAIQKQNDDNILRGFLEECQECLGEIVR